MYRSVKMTVAMFAFMALTVSGVTTQRIPGGAQQGILPKPGSGKDPSPFASQIYVTDLCCDFESREVSSMHFPDPQLLVIAPRVKNS